MRFVYFHHKMHGKTGLVCNLSPLSPLDNPAAIRERGRVVLNEAVGVGGCVVVDGRADGGVALGLLLRGEICVACKEKLGDGFGWCSAFAFLR